MKWVGEDEARKTVDKRLSASFIYKNGLCLLFRHWSLAIANPLQGGMPPIDDRRE